MFFGRIGPKSSDTKEAMFTTSKKRRQLAAVSLAVAMAAPAGLMEVSKLYGQEAPAAPSTDAGDMPLFVQEQGAASGVELLKSAIEQYKAGQYEEAQATIGQIKVEELSEKNKSTLDDLSGQVNKAADQRKAARAEFEAGQQSLENKQSAEALAQFKAAASNKYVDQGTRQKALEQIALAEKAEEQAAVQRKADYKQAQADYEAGNYDSAKGKFEALAAAGYKAPLFQKSPEGYLKEIAKKTAQPAAAPVAEAVAEAPKGEETPKAEVAAAAPAAAAAASADDAQAKADAEKAKAAAEQEKADRAAAEAEAKQAAQAEKEAATARKAEAKRLYGLAKEQYKKGDWIASRANFVAAQDLGYKAGLFEDSPATYLARMDKKEQADAAKAAKEAEARAQREADEKAQAEAEANAKKMVAEEQQKKAVAAAPGETPGVVEVTPKAEAEKSVAPKAEAPVAAAPKAETPKAEVTAAAPVPAPAAPEVVSGTDKAKTELEATAQLEKIRQQQKAYEASQLVEQGKTAAAESRYADALAAYSKAAELDPSNQQAVQGRAEMQALAGRAPTQSGLLNRVQQQNETRRQAITYSFNTALDASNAAIDGGDFRTARTQLAAARVAAESDPTIFTPEDIRKFNSQIAATAGRLDAAEAKAAATAEQEKTAEAVKSQQLKAEQEQKLRENTVANLIKAARRAIEENKYREAVGILDQILVIDPHNEYAQGVKPLVEDKAILIEQRTYREEFTRNMEKQLNASEEKKIPYDDIFRYPTNWPDISATREASVEKERGGSEADAAVRAQLEHRIPEVRFDAIPFSDVVDFLRDITGANIFVNWRALEAAGVDRNTPVTTRLRDVRFSKALETILRDVGGGTVQMTYTVDDGVIMISTAEDLSKNTITRVYDIRDLIVETPDFYGPQFSLQSAQQSGSGGGGGQSLFQNQQQQQQQNIQPKTREDRVLEITSLMQESIAPDSWRDAGGTVGSLRELNGQLIVAQTPENQRAIQGLLEQLRETRAIQITVETRFLTVQRNFMEDIGFDFDFIFNGNNPVQAYNPTGGADPNAVAKVPGTGSWSAIPVINNSSAFTGPGTVTTGAPGTLNREFTAINGLTATGTFLDDFQVSFLIRATQAQRQTTLLTAPRLTLFNGQTAYVLVAVSQPYVSDLQPVVGTQAVAFDPTISTVNSGVMLQVQATVSADRKYVTMTLQPTLQTLLALVNFSFQQAGNSTGVTSGGQLINTSAGTGIIQEPVTQVTQVATSVSVPDGGTLLLGGQTIAGETELEAGVPVLSKIPFLKRLFTNRSTAKDEQVLLILVKPTIIIQRELEEKQFPMLSQKVGG